MTDDLDNSYMMHAKGCEQFIGRDSVELFRITFKSQLYKLILAQSVDS